MVYTFWTVAARVGCSKRHFLWRIPKWEINVYMHCQLFEEGAKVLTRRANERLAETMEAMMKQLRKAARKNPCPDSK